MIREQTLARNLVGNTQEGNHPVSSELQIDYLISLPKFLNGRWKRCSLCSVEEIGPGHVKLRWIGENGEQYNHVSRDQKVISQAWTSLLAPFSNQQYSVRAADMDAYSSQLEAMRSFYGVTLPANPSVYWKTSLAGNVQTIIQSGHTVKLEDLRRFGLYPEGIDKGQDEHPCRAAASFKLSHTVEYLVHFSEVNEALLSRIPFERLPDQSDADFETWKQEWLSREIAVQEALGSTPQTLVAGVRLHVKPIPIDLIRRRLARQDEGGRA